MRVFTTQSTHQTFDLSAASDFTNSNPSLEALLQKLAAANPTNLTAQLPSPENAAKEETPQSSSTSKSATPDSTHTPPTKPPSAPPVQAPDAVARCINAYNQTLREAEEKRYSEYECKKKAEHSYLSKIPTLDKPENINGFIACVAHAMLINIIRAAEGTKILYAAQIATQATQTSRNIANRNKSAPEIPQ